MYTLIYTGIGYYVREWHLLAEKAGKKSGEGGWKVPEVADGGKGGAGEEVPSPDDWERQEPIERKLKLLDSKRAFLLRQACLIL
jgi:hypothetical protein